MRAARELMHEQGFHRTTLAHVAARSRVPLGNVHYYFKTKEALAQAVIVAHELALQACFAAWTKAHVDPLGRLRQLALAPLAMADAVVRYGCPHGGLFQELRKLRRDAPLAKAAERLLNTYLSWSAEQFSSLGHRSREAREHAQQLVASLQGIMLLSHTLRSEEVLKRQLRVLVDWLHELQAAAPPRPRTRRSH